MFDAKINELASTNLQKDFEIQVRPSTNLSFEEYQISSDLNEKSILVKIDVCSNWLVN